MWWTREEVGVAVVGAPAVFQSNSQAVVNNTQDNIAELPLSPESKPVIYADDVLLYRPIRQASEYQLLQQDVESLGKWANNDYLTLILILQNQKPCMVFSRNRQPWSAPSYITLNGSRLEIVDSVEYLGIAISSDLSWTKHKNIISSKAQKLVGCCFGSFIDVQIWTSFITFTLPS